MSTTLAEGRLWLSMPVIIRPPRTWDRELIREAKFVARANSVMVDLEGMDIVDNKHLMRVMWDTYIEKLGALVITNPQQVMPGVNVPTYVRITEAGEVSNAVNALARKNNWFDGVIIDINDDYPEAHLVRLDVELRRRGIRDNVDLLIHMPNIRSSGDIIKLVALGADAVIISGFVERALHGYSGIEDFRLRFMKFLIGVKREIAQLLGAAGIYSLQSVVGNRELLRALSGRVRDMLMVKLAGEDVLYR
nr:hypothetical protein [Vulcanisaeta sp. JCM 16159]